MNRGWICVNEITGWTSTENGCGLLNWIHICICNGRYIVSSDDITYIPGSVVVPWLPALLVNISEWPAPRSLPKLSLSNSLLFQMTICEIQNFSNTKWQTYETHTVPSKCWCIIWVWVILQRTTLVTNWSMYCTSTLSKWETCCCACFMHPAAL